MSHRSPLFAGIIVLGLAGGPFGADAHDLTASKRVMTPADPFQSPALAKFIPSAVSVPTKLRLRGLIDSLNVWETGSTVRVCFLSGTLRARARVARVAQEWTSIANIKLDFGGADAPRQCSSEESAAITVAFAQDGKDAGYWSYLGRNSLKYRPSMNLEGLGADGLPDGMSEERARGIVLHEFGHALGLAHEHQHPHAACEEHINWSAAYAWGAQAGWAKEEVDFNVRSIVLSPSVMVTDYDRASVMHYRFPLVLFLESAPAECRLQAENNRLSEGDKKLIATVYPGKKEAQLAAHQAILDDYRATLRAGGVDDTTVRELADGLRQAIVVTISGQVAGNVVTAPGSQKSTGDCSPNLQGVGGNVTITLECASRK